MAVLVNIFVLVLLAGFTQAQLGIIQENCRNSSLSGATCVELPINCSTSADPCLGAAYFTPNGNNSYSWGVAANNDHEYVALGFSRDTTMSSEAVIDCFRDNGTVKIRPAYNGPSRFTHYPLESGTEVPNLYEINSGSDDNGIYCNFEIDTSITINNYSANLTANNSYYLLLAVGPLSGTTHLPLHHDDKIISDLIVFP